MLKIVLIILNFICSILANSKFFFIYLIQYHLSIIFYIVNHGMSIPQLDGRIIGGTNVRIQDHPHQISLRYLNSHICGGFIIAPKFVVTAAHCTDG